MERPLRRCECGQLFLPMDLGYDNKCPLCKEKEREKKEDDKNKNTKNHF